MSLILAWSITLDSTFKSLKVGDVRAEVKNVFFTFGLGTYYLIFVSVCSVYVDNDYWFWVSTKKLFQIPLKAIWMCRNSFFQFFTFFIVFSMFLHKSLRPRSLTHYNTFQAVPILALNSRRYSYSKIDSPHRWVGESTRLPGVSIFSNL